MVNKETYTVTQAELWLTNLTADESTQKRTAYGHLLIDNSDFKDKNLFHTYPGLQEFVLEPPNCSGVQIEPQIRQDTPT